MIQRSNTNCLDCTAPSWKTHYTGDLGVWDGGHQYHSSTGSDGDCAGPICTDTPTTPTHPSETSETRDHCPQRPVASIPTGTTAAYRHPASHRQPLPPLSGPGHQCPHPEHGVLLEQGEDQVQADERGSRGHGHQLYGRVNVAGATRDDCNDGPDQHLPRHQSALPAVKTSHSMMTKNSFSQSYHYSKRYSSMCTVPPHG